MNLDKAIEILSDSANRGMTTFNQDYKDAQRLGLEALKRILVYRKPPFKWQITPLSGETKG